MPGARPPVSFTASLYVTVLLFSSAWKRRSLSPPRNCSAPLARRQQMTGPEGVWSGWIRIESEVMSVNSFFRQSLMVVRASVTRGEPARKVSRAT